MSDKPKVSFPVERDERDTWAIHGARTVNEHPDCGALGPYYEPPVSNITVIDNVMVMPELQARDFWRLYFDLDDED